MTSPQPHYRLQPPLPKGNVSAQSLLLILNEPSEETKHSAREGWFSRSKRWFSRQKEIVVTTVVRTFRLQLFQSALYRIRGKTVPEKEKVVIYKSRRRAMLRGLIHWPPVLAAGGLVVLNSAQYYIGGELTGASGQDSEKLQALQFAAKLHELLMFASISTIVFDCIRHEILFGDGVNLGAVFAGQQFQEISNLWSMEFWSAISVSKQRWRSRRKTKWWLVALILLATILGASVGPSTANLMRPRLDWWPAGGTTFWLNATHDSLYPIKYDDILLPTTCMNVTGDVLCPYGGFEAIGEEYLSFWPAMKPMGSMPESISIPSHLALRRMKMNNRNYDNSSRLIWGGFDVTSASVPITSVANAVTETTRLWAYAARNAASGNRFGFRLDVSHSVETYSPVVKTFCLPFGVSSPNFTYPNYTLSFVNFTSETPNSDKAKFPPIQDIADVQTNTWLARALVNASQPSLRWIDDASLLNATGSQLLAIAAFPAGIVGGPQYFCCSIKATLGHGTIVGTRNDPKIVYQDPPAINGSQKAVGLSASWAAYTDAYIPNLRTSVFPYLAAKAGLSRLPPDIANPYPIFAVESVIASMLANGMSHMPYGTAMAGTLKGMVDPSSEWSGGAWVDQFMPTTPIGFGGDAYDIDNQTAQAATLLTMQASCNGYAYSARGLSQKAFIVVLSVYCLLTLWHFFRHNIKNGWTSGAWDTVPELTALALNSERSRAMDKTGAGIYSFATMEETVMVRTKEDRVEMVFRDTSAGKEIVSPGHAYC